MSEIQRPTAQEIYSNLSVNNADVTSLSIALGISDRRVRDLVKEGKLVPHSYQPKMLFNLPKAIGDYIAFKMTSPTESEDPLKQAKIDQTKADTKLKEAKAEKAQIELAEFKGMMHRSEDVEAITNDLVYAVRAGILSLPGRLAVDMANLQTANECSGRIRQECNILLYELTKYEYDPKKYRDRVRERERLEAIEAEEIRSEIKASSKSVSKRGRGRKAKKDTEEVFE